MDADEPEVAEIIEAELDEEVELAPEVLLLEEGVLTLDAEEVDLNMEDNDEVEVDDKLDRELDLPFEDSKDDVGDRLSVPVTTLTFQDPPQIRLSPAHFDVHEESGNL